MSSARAQSIKDAAFVEPELSAEERKAVDEAIVLIYQNLRHRARMLIRQERNCSLQGTDLVHEVLPALRKIREARNGDLLLAIAMRIMTHKLIDHARKKAAICHGNGVHHTTLARASGVAAISHDQHSIHDALAQLSPEQQHITRMKIWGGFTEKEIAALTGRHPDTIKNEWRRITTCLHRILKG